MSTIRNTTIIQTKAKDAGSELESVLNEEYQENGYGFYFEKKDKSGKKEVITQQYSQISIKSRVIRKQTNPRKLLKKTCEVGEIGEIGEVNDNFDDVGTLTD